MSEEITLNNKNTDTIIDNLSDSIWMQTPLSDFGFKCVMNQHDSCNELKCACLCHHYNH